MYHQVVAVFQVQFHDFDGIKKWILLQMHLLQGMTINR